MSAGGRRRARADAVVVGSGPNGLAARPDPRPRGTVGRGLRGRRRRAGGGCRTEELTLPGFAHDVCSTVHPLLAASPFFSRARAARASTLKTPEVAFAHPLDGGRAAAVAGSVEQHRGVARRDARRYRRLFGRSSETRTAIVPSVLAPLLRPPRHPLAMARFGLRGAVAGRRVLARRFHTAGRARCWPAWAPIRCDR